MDNVVLDISMSLDGFVTALNVSPDEPLGDDGQQLHEWTTDSDRSRELIARMVEGPGAYIAGRRTYDTSLPWWGADGPTGPARVPLFVLSHSEPEDVPAGGVYQFVTAWSMRSQFTSYPCFSAAEPACSITSARRISNSRPPR